MEKLFSLIGDVSHTKLGGADSYSDQLNCRYTVFLLSLFALLASARVYVDEPISCFCPAEFSASQVAFAKKVGIFSTPISPSSTALSLSFDLPYRPLQSLLPPIPPLRPFALPPAFPITSPSRLLSFSPLASVSLSLNPRPLSFLLLFLLPLQFHLSLRNNFLLVHYLLILYLFLYLLLRPLFLSLNLLFFLVGNIADCRL